MTVYVADTDFTLHQGDCLEILRGLPASSVHCCVTSPPYWGLRDYGSDGQIGLEQTPDEFVAQMVDVFREVRRVLHDDGTLWLNLGDSYAGSGPSGASYQSETTKRRAAGDGTDGNFRISKTLESRGLTYAEKKPVAPPGLKSKDLVGIPWRVAFALQADGWWLRSDIIWSKPNPMPESVTDRPTKAHEYVFLLTKSSRYFYDGAAIREPATFYGPNGANGSRDGSPHAGQMLARSGNKQKKRNPASSLPNGEFAHGIPWEGFDRNARSVWEIATKPYAEAHFATFPQELPRRCIAAGTSERGCCPECGAPWERDTERIGESTYAQIKREHGITYKDMKAEAAANGITPGNVGGTHAPGQRGANLPPAQFKMLGWKPTCDHGHAPVPATVLDPFMGSGTTALVARHLGRKSVGIELNPEYCALTARRLQQLSLLADA